MKTSTTEEWAILDGLWAWANEAPVNLQRYSSVRSVEGQGEFVPVNATKGYVKVEV